MVERVSFAYSSLYQLNLTTHASLMLYNYSFLTFTFSSCSSLVKLAYSNSLVSTFSSLVLTVTGYCLVIATQQIVAESIWPTNQQFEYLLNSNLTLDLLPRYYDSKCKIKNDYLLVPDYLQHLSLVLHSSLSNQSFQHSKAICKVQHDLAMCPLNLHSYVNFAQMSRHPGLRL